MKYYNKLVRDKIPDIIKASGQQAHLQVLEPAEFQTALDQKLGEELQEYLESGSIEELADLVEVVQAILELKGVTASAFEQMRMLKAEERGGFRQRLLLVSVE